MKVLPVVRVLEKDSEKVICTGAHMAVTGSSGWNSMEPLTTTVV